MARTLGDLEDRVGYLLDMTIGATSDPTTTEVTQWLNDAQKEIARLTDPNAIPGLIDIDDQSIAAVSEVTLPTDYLKYISGTLNIDGSGSDDYPLHKITPQQANHRYTNEFLEGTATSPVIWIEDGKFKFSPATTGGAAAGKLIVKYLKIPADKATGVVPDTPEYLDEALVSYATAIAKVQEEELQQYGIFMSKFLQLLLQFQQRVNGGR